MIGANGVKLSDEEAARLAVLTMHEVPVCGQTEKLANAVRSFSGALKPSRADISEKQRFFVGELDGPKYLYIFQLEGGVANWVGDAVDDGGEQMTIKLGFSKAQKKVGIRSRPLTQQDSLDGKSFYPIPLLKLHRTRTQKRP